MRGAAGARGKSGVGRLVESRKQPGLSFVDTTQTNRHRRHAGPAIGGHANFELQRVHHRQRGRATLPRARRVSLSYSQFCFGNRN